MAIAAMTRTRAPATAPTMSLRILLLGGSREWVLRFCNTKTAPPERGRLDIYRTITSRLLGAGRVARLLDGRAVVVADVRGERPLATRALGRRGHVRLLLLALALRRGLRLQREEREDGVLRGATRVLALVRRDTGRHAARRHRRLQRRRALRALQLA